MEGGTVKINLKNLFIILNLEVGAVIELDNQPQDSTTLEVVTRRVDVENVERMGYFLKDLQAVFDKWSPEKNEGEKEYQPVPPSEKSGNEIPFS